MSEQTEMAPDVATKGESTYTIQVEKTLEVITARPTTKAQTAPGGAQVPPKPLPPESKNVVAWQDVATVTVPARTHRKRLITKALMDAGITPEPGKPAPRVRVLDEESAFVHEPEAKQPPAEWVIS